jgi:hypothetical protein
MNLTWLTKPQTLSKEQIAALDPSYKGVETITVILTEDAQGKPTKTADYVICQPPRKVVEAAADMALAEGNIRYINACVLAGDLELMDAEDAVYYAVLAAVKNKVEAKKLLS